MPLPRRAVFVNVFAEMNVGRALQPAKHDTQARLKGIVKVYPHNKF